MAAVKTALKLKKERKSSTLDEPIVVVTILCDSGSRHLSKFWNDDVLRSMGIDVADDIQDLLVDSAVPPPS